MLLSAGVVGGCSTCPKTPDSPEEGTYEVTNPDDLPVTITSVVIADQRLTVRYLDEAGVEQYMIYVIRH